METIWTAANNALDALARKQSVKRVHIGRATTLINRLFTAINGEIDAVAFAQLYHAGACFWQIPRIVTSQKQQRIRLNRRIVAQLVRRFPKRRKPRILRTRRTQLVRYAVARQIDRAHRLAAIAHKTRISQVRTMRKILQVQIVFRKERTCARARRTLNARLLRSYGLCQGCRHLFRHAIRSFYGVKPHPPPFDTEIANASSAARLKRRRA